jgi:hypothetical protein
MPTPGISANSLANLTFGVAIPKNYFNASKIGPVAIFMQRFELPDRQRQIGCRLPT